MFSHNTISPVSLIISFLMQALVVLFGILIAHALYRAIVKQDTQDYVRCLVLSEGLDKIKNVVTIAGWAAI